MIRNTAVAAERIRQVLIYLSPMVEEYTAKVCPDCRDVCCKQRHGIMNEQDLRYQAALGAPLPVYDAARPLDGPCQFMGTAGCISPRWLRPWRCTSYFCDALLAAMNNGPQKKARQVSALIQEIVDIRGTW
jgi:hypothetical protein